MDIGQNTDSFSDKDTLEVECSMENLTGYKDDEWDKTEIIKVQELWMVSGN